MMEDGNTVHLNNLLSRHVFVRKILVAWHLSLYLCVVVVAVVVSFILFKSSFEMYNYTAGWAFMGEIHETTT